MRWRFLLASLLLPVSFTGGQDRKPVGTTIQLPTFGVAVDAAGELTVKSFIDPTGQLHAQRVAAARARLPADIAAPSELRKVSLAGVERALAEYLEAGKPVDESLLYLAGLQRARYVFLYPESNDVVIAGPAEGWVADPSGRVVGLSSGRPVLRLDDLAVALRVYAPAAGKRPFLGCTIDPPEEGLARLRQFQKTIPHVVAASQRAEVAAVCARGTRTALGMAEVRLFGVSPATHFARVLLEADYRMKCMAVGLEPPPVKMTTFLGSLRSPPANTLQRWWLTPDYECVRLSDDGLAMEIAGQGVQLQTEDRAIAADGQLTRTGGAPHPAAAAFAKSFTDRYTAIAAVSPVYAELRNLIDLAIAAAWLRQRDAAALTGWSAEVLRDEGRFATETLTTPKKVACVANAVWTGNRLLVPAGGGVSISPDEALQQIHLLPVDSNIGQKHKTIADGRPADHWWWD